MSEKPKCKHPHAFAFYEGELVHLLCRDCGIIETIKKTELKQWIIARL
jgi:hypothetical protein